MALLTDETLMAYADGELDAAARARVETILERDQESRARLEIFTATGAPLAALYGKPMTEPVPSHLVALVLGEKKTERSFVRPAARKRRYAGNFADALRMMFAGPQWTMAFALCALILVVGAGAGWYLHNGSDGSMQGLVSLDGGRIFAQGPFKAALETVPSGTKVTIADKKGQTVLTMRAALTFKNRQQAFCRQYDVTAPEGQYAGIACRGDDNQWRLELHTAAAPRANRSDRTVPAGASGSSDVEAAVSNVIEGDALGRTEEDALLRNKWRP